MKLMIKPVFSLIVIGTMSTAFADPAKCSPCQAAKSIRDEIKQSIKDAAAAALAAGGAFTREQELDIASDICSKCGCSRTTRDEFAQEIEKCGCGKPRTTRDEVTQKIEVAEIAQAALAAAQAIIESELDEIPDLSRAPREELVDPCNPCGPVPVCEINACTINAQLKALRCCCESLTQRVACQGAQARKCCKKLKHKIEDVEELVETVIDQSAACCSVTESVLGDPLTASILDIPLCDSVSVTDSLINSTDADVITWLKSLYALLYRVHSCVCCG